MVCLRTKLQERTCEQSDIDDICSEIAAVDFSVCTPQFTKALCQTQNQGSVSYKLNNPNNVL